MFRDPLHSEPHERAVCHTSIWRFIGHRSFAIKHCTFRRAHGRFISQRIPLTRSSRRGAIELTAATTAAACDHDHAGKHYDGDTAKLIDDPDHRFTPRLRREGLLSLAFLDVNNPTRKKVLNCKNPAKYVCWASDYFNPSAKPELHVLAAKFMCGDPFLHDMPVAWVFACEECRPRFHIRLEKFVFPEQRRRVNRNHLIFSID